MINLFSKKSASQVNLDKISSEKLIENLDETREEFLAGGANKLFVGNLSFNSAQQAAVTNFILIID
ncbi:hypothetical protein NIES2119_06335 [[Phormidium ambiguum] IAM M-71]|uniref:Uncharacterized protein n=1 Tax=[Phormidium ambiguum] IAM M-71 TaxID=454136 RepID=A0A1U7IPU2_9CYAN|nr:hypothetical protein [Phormidium ambiguum]OKH39355.1 hypothetical protein NIES2119_06335 [Phormidium ambiguum IAM M-71]